MELLLRDGDYVSDGAGGQVRLEGEAALLQRVLFRLAARRGQFAPLPELGSELYALGRERGSRRLPAARQYVAQALVEEDPELSAPGNRLLRERVKKLFSQSGEAFN